jgi:hypothetical protein
MILLLTLSPDGCTKETLLLKYDTDKDKGEFFGSKYLSTNKVFKGTSGLTYSGNQLCVGIQSYKNIDLIAFFNAYEDQCMIHQCKYIKDIGNIISVYPGKLYVDSQSTNSICAIDFDPVNLFYFEDAIHYVFKDDISYKIKSLYGYNFVWYIALQDKRRIIDLTNDRVVFSDISKPCCIFFNRNQRLCFIESEFSLFHCGDDIFKVGNNPTTAIEDDKKGGYWIACGAELQFINYEGNLMDSKDLSKWGNYYNNIVEAKGRFTE